MLLTLDDVTKRYGATVAVRHLSLMLAAGEVLCLLGPNGAGKTTTLKMILGLETPSEGAVRVAGLDVSQNVKAVRRRMAYIPEMVALHEAFTGRENLRYFASLVGGAHLSAAHLEHCLRRVGLQEDAWDRRLSGYSKGMRQKVGVAIALAKGAELLVLDEPTSGLDPKSAVDFARLVQDVAAEGAGVIMATHDLFRAKDMGTRIVILKDGVAVETLDPKERSYNDVENVYLGVFEAEA
ncbi:MAG: ABC transporter ATP-binding protein [Bacteroidota bacterium]